jgi:hypothetical protein
VCSYSEGFRLEGERLRGIFEGESIELRVRRVRFADGVRLDEALFRLLGLADFNSFSSSTAGSSSSSSESGTSGINNEPSLGNSKREGATVDACRLATGILGDLGRLIDRFIGSMASVRSYYPQKKGWGRRKKKNMAN